MNRMNMIWSPRRTLGLLVGTFVLGMGAGHFFEGSPAAMIPHAQIEAAEGEDSIDLRYLRAERDLVQAQLKYVTDMNSKSSNFYLPIIVEELRLKAKSLDETVREMEQTGTVFVRKAEIRAAEARLKLAEFRLQETLDLQKRLPDDVSELDVARRRAALKAAQLALERLKTRSSVPSERERLFWRMLQIERDIMQLKIAVGKHVPTGDLP